VAFCPYVGGACVGHSLGNYGIQVVVCYREWEPVGKWPLRIEW